MIVTQGGQSLKLHVAALQLPLVVLLEQQRTYEADDGGFVGEDADDIGATFDLRVESLERIGAVDLRSVSLRERHERQHFGLSGIHQLTELRQLHAQLVCNDPSMLGGGLERVLRERRIDRGEHHLPLSLSGVGERIA